MTQPIDWNNPSASVSKHFTVAEVTQNDDRRLPAVGSDEEAAILNLAVELDKVRDAWGSAIGVTSWYRPYEINLACGGVVNSQHIYGSAADIYTMDGRDAEFETFLDENWGGGLGYGVASGRGFTHCDLRRGGFKYGDGAIRWMY
ncbi:MAG: hypothetical protein KME13_21585 [Myxacorys californica WJT36-NPBG1]|jgi:uncharacterized protein YcbK (DUF882 family)|nr:hypothetical protein [Myxacorys californica WJT36-NPBG1]